MRPFRPLGELFLDLSAAIGAVALRSPFHQAPLDGTFGSLRPHARSRVARIKNIFELLTVVHARVAHHVTAMAVDADMVLVTEIRAFMLLRPARVLVLLAVLGRLGFPVFRHLAVLDRLVLLARTEGAGYRMVLLCGRYDRSIDDLPAPGEIALVLQEPVKQIEQLFHRAALASASR